MAIEKLRMETTNIADENFKKLQELFPEAVTEIEENGEIIRAINKDALQELINTKVVGSDKEHYELIWPGKLQAKHIAIEPTTKTLRPVIATKDREGNEDNWYKDCFNKTENLYIEGDNLEVLKLMQEQYRGKIKMIYIDPPYNRGEDLIYKDNYAQSIDEYKQSSGQVDEEGNRLIKNLESNGRFHSDWLSMMYPRLKIAKNMLADNGVIFISIDDHEQSNLKKMCDEIFGETNFCGDILWNSTKSVTNTALISVSHTYNLIYFKRMSYFVENRHEFRVPDNGEGFENPDNDSRGPWKADPFQVGGWRPNQQYEIINPNTGVIYRPNPGCSWKNDYNKFKELLTDNRIVFGKTGDGGPLRKRFIWEAQERGKVVKTCWDDVETTTNGTQLLKKIFNGMTVFDNPKPIGLLKRMLELGMNNDGICLDFFSGSATTAHAVMQLNAEDGGNRKFIMVQWPENCDEKAYNAGFNTICDIGKERIRRAGVKIKEELEKTNPERAKTLDTGFRVLRLDSSNMKEKVAQKAGEIRQESISDFISNIKEDRTDLDLLFQALPLLGADYTAKITEDIIDGKKVFIVDDGYIVACFDSDINNTVIEKIASMKPVHAVFRDKCFENDSVYTNLEQIFKKHNENFDSNPDTRQIVIL